MPPRIPESERLRHKVLIALNDDQYSMLMDEARDRNLAPSIIGRLAFAEGLPEIRKKTAGGTAPGCLCEAQNQGRND